MDIKDQNIFNQLTFEIIDRIVRFSLHISEIRAQFYNEKTNNSDKITFIKKYDEILHRLFIIVRDNYTKDISSFGKDNRVKIIDNLNSCFEVLNKLHKKWLTYLPRPNEPIELRRFCRVLEEQFIILEPGSPKQKISVYVTEELGEEAYATEPLKRFKESEVNPVIAFSNIRLEEIVENYKKVEEFDFSNSKNTSDIFHFTIPRIEAGNPIRWPSLVHELAHKLFDKIFKEREIESDFLNTLSKDQINGFSNFFKQISLIDWLTECWCDLFGSVLIGPSFYFSQYHSFCIQEFDSTSKNFHCHPPNLFRLNLIEKILYHRFSKDSFSIYSKQVADCETIISILDNKNNPLSDSRESTILFQLFRHYFLKHFFKSEDGKIKVGDSELNDKIQEIVNNYVNIDHKIIDNLNQTLKNGQPIPSFVAECSENTYQEYATNIQEIFLVGWLYRNREFKEMVLSSLVKSKKLSIEKISQDLQENFVKIFSRFDHSILRSIQVSEWVNLLGGDKRRTVRHTFAHPMDINLHSEESILNDKQIEDYIKNQEIKIIPIINLNEQLGTTSIDIRLGTTFQKFFPNQIGIFDITLAESVEDSSFNSIRHDLDFMESITITPGEFLLGHSMEYFKLPNNIIGDLEGRSSFARLGLEIHKTAGFIDPGFEGVLTFEIYNAGPNPIKLFPGIRIGQIRFSRIKKPQVFYNQRHSAKYKGLLEHHRSLQAKDYEVSIIINKLKDIEQKNI